MKSKVIVNCTGVFSDILWRMNKSDVEDRTLSARGTHIVLDKGLMR